MDRAELADFLRTRRARITPGEVGLAAGARRRTPGLRREEVAALAAMSADYYTRLEQGRGPRPSPQVLDGLARALRLDRDQHAHLFHLAGHAPPPVPGPAHDVSPGVLHLLDRLTDGAAFVLDAKYDVLAWNPLAAALVADFSAWLPSERNMIWQLFRGTSGGGHYSGEQWRDFARTCVADLRSAAARYPDDDGIRALVARLLAHSAEFRAMWADHEVASQQAMSKRIDHPAVGPIDLDCDVLLAPDRDQRIIVYTALPGSASHEALRLLAVIGLQDVGGASAHDPLVER